MKKLSKLLWMLLGIMALPSMSIAQPRQVGKEEAFQEVKSMFINRDVDYFIINEPDSVLTWNFFVDAEPMKGWSHECYVIKVNKTSDASGIHTQAIQMTLPPFGDIKPLEFKKRYSTGDKESRQRVSASAKKQTPNPMSNRTHAIILNGGGSVISNHERYWNDCSFLYKTLVNSYSIPKYNIYPVMSNGMSWQADMIDVDGNIVCKSHDLDEDGIDEYIYSAESSDLNSILWELRYKMNPEDHLLIYVIDHGERKGAGSYIVMWGNWLLSSRDFADMLKPLSEKGVNINVVLGQCYSGGFITDLERINCVVATASLPNEPSYACSDIPYDEFVYNWTCAINGANHTGHKIDADRDANGFITMEEAFIYASMNDRSMETPQYKSTPRSIGEDLALNHIAPSVDLYLQDDIWDYGKQPNRNPYIYNSPSIWVRQIDDKLETHQNPMFSRIKSSNYVYVRVHNRGKQNYDGGQFARAYWTLCASSASAASWYGQELTSKNNPTGGGMDIQEIPPIPAGESRVLCFEWIRPAALLEYPYGDISISLYAKILGEVCDDLYISDETTFSPGDSNDESQKNTILSWKTVTLRPIDLTVIPDINGRFTLISDTTDDMEIRWTDSEGKLLGTTPNIQVLPHKSNDKYTIETTDKSGESSGATISLTGMYGLDKVELSDDCSEITVYLKNPASKDAIVSLIALNEGRTVCSRSVIESEQTVSIKPDCMKNGLYAVCLYVNSVLIDQQNIIIQ